MYYSIQADKRKEPVKLPFPFYHFPIISKFQQHFQTIWRNSKPFGKTLYNLAKLYFLAKVRGFAKKYPSFPNRYAISGIQKRKKERPANHSGEPLYA